MNESVLERLSKTNPDLEIWWDSSPLVFNPWVRKMVDAAEPARKPILKEQLGRLYNANDPAKSVFRGCTTNPPLSWGAVQSDTKFWGKWIDNLLRTTPGLTLKDATWSTYKEVVKRGSEMFLPIFEASKGRFGWISGQLDPRLFTEVELMVKGADELRALNTNVMVKVPASMQGIEVLKILASKGISTNTTTCFTLPQILASANATREGIKIAEKNKVDLSKWRAVITQMIGRLTEMNTLDVQAERHGVSLTWQDKHWFGIAVFRRAYRILTEEGYPSKMLACSLRAGPLVAGKERFWDIEKLAGGDIVYTLPPYVLEPLFAIGDGLEMRPEIDEPVPASVLDKMSRIPYCIQAYDPNGMDLEQFNDHPSTVATVKAFSKSITDLEAFVGERMAAQQKIAV